MTDGVVHAGTFNGSLLQSVPDLDATGLHGMLANGVAFMPSGKVFLSTAHHRTDVDATADALEKVLRQL
ncbi:hypothetical protein ABTX77_34920 [Streptomyces sp. NPDC097704]|uniref:hypothetical protein n=1 Tax=Streptomyces sp. NPDC097704 TaxID=3157101 RepID=UPI0033339C27